MPAANPTTKLAAVSALLSAHGTVSLGLGTLHFRGERVAFVQGDCVIVAPVIRGLDIAWAARNTGVASADAVAREILQRVATKAAA